MLNNVAKPKVCPPTQGHRRPSHTAYRLQFTRRVLCIYIWNGDGVAVAADVFETRFCIWRPRSYIRQCSDSFFFFSLFHFFFVWKWQQSDARPRREDRSGHGRGSPPTRVLPSRRPAPTWRQLSGATDRPIRFVPREASSSRRLRCCNYCCYSDLHVHGVVCYTRFITKNNVIHYDYLCLYVRRAHYEIGGNACMYYVLQRRFYIIAVDIRFFSSAIVLSIVFHSS